MPALAVWFLRAALLHLAAGITLGALMLANKGYPLSPALLSLLPAHLEILFIGWTVQLAFGVGYWILPRFAGGQRGTPLGERLALLSFILINTGVVLAALVVVPGLPDWVALAGRAAETASAAAFTLSIWRRIRPTYR